MSLRIQGYAAVFDRVDRAGDVLRAGVFADAVPVPLLMQHRGAPVGEIWAIGEDARGLWIEACVTNPDVVQRTRREVTLDAAAIDVLPGSVVTIAGEGQGNAWRVATVRAEQFRVTLTLVALAPPSIPMRASAGRMLPAPDAPAGRTVVQACELPDLTGTAANRPQVTIVAAGTGSGWRRAALHTSLDDGARWVPAAATRAPGVLGVVTSALGAGVGTLIDRRHTIEVTLLHAGMALADADALALDRGANLATVGNEVLQFAQAEQIGATHWRLSALRRALFGTTAEPVDGGSAFVLLDGNTVVSIPIDAPPGGLLRVMANGVGDDVPAETTLVLTGRSIVPPAPVRLTARIADDHLYCTWRRRSRSDWRWRDGVDAALIEERERYRLVITGSGGSITLETDAPFAAVPLAAIGDAPRSVRVQQMGTHGLSPTAILNC